MTSTFYSSWTRREELYSTSIIDNGSSPRQSLGRDDETLGLPLNSLAAREQATVVTRR